MFLKAVLETAHISSALKNLVTKINLGSREARKYFGWVATGPE